MHDSFLTVKEIAELVKLNQQTVRNMIDRGELKAVRVGQRRVRVRQSELQRFLARGERPRGRANHPAEPATNDLRNQFVRALEAILERARTEEPRRPGGRTP